MTHIQVQLWSVIELTHALVLNYRFEICHIFATISFNIHTVTCLTSSRTMNCVRATPPLPEATVTNVDPKPHLVVGSGVLPPRD